MDTCPGNEETHSIMNWKKLRRLPLWFDYFSVQLISSLSCRCLVVMGGDSCSKGRGFESKHHKLDGHFFTFIFCLKNLMFV